MMRPLCTFAALLALLGTATAQPSYYFPEGSTFDDSIPSPEAFLGYPIGTWHTRHDRLVAYFQHLAAISPRAHLRIIGHTHELRPQVVLTISSPHNLARLEEIQRAHQALADPMHSMPDTSVLPAVLLLGYGVHGNEASSAEAAMLVAWYLLAAKEARPWLDQLVIHIDPVYNPDGRDRHTLWVNMHQGTPPVADPLDREHNEAWPRGRTNHYWFDLNRDWLPLVQPESRHRVAFYHEWLPNVATDYHEMGTHDTYFFEPTKPVGSENPLVPRRNYDELNHLFAEYFSEALDAVGALYYTRESFDNSYPGYGSTYPDLHGGLGLLFEQARSGGRVQHTPTEDLHFRFTIRNQVRTSLATVQATVAHRTRLLAYKRWFFEYALEAARQAQLAGWVFAAPHDPTRLRSFLDLLRRHHIEAWPLRRRLSADGIHFEAGSSWFVPARQPQYLLAASIFEPRTNDAIPDSVFYDASAWALALAWNLELARLTQPPDCDTTTSLAGGQLQPEPARATYAWIVDWRDYGAAAFLWHLLDKGVHVKTAFKPFAVHTTAGERSFSYGSLLIAVHDQALHPDSLYRLIRHAARHSGVPAHAVSSGRSIAGIDLGSRNFRAIEKPRPLMVVGRGVSAYEAGQVWHLLDTRVHMPITKVDVADWHRVNLWDYNTLVLVSGRYDFSEEDVQRIKEWLAAGHTLVAIRGGAAWAMQKKLVADTLLPPPADTSQVRRRDFDEASQWLGARRLGGVVFEADVDPSHPVGFGFTRRRLYVWRDHDYVLPPSKNAFSTVVQLASDKPQADGYVHPELLRRVQGTASCIVSAVGRGRAVLLLDNPNFRGLWYGTNRLFFNSLFFGSLVHVPQR